MLGFLLARSMFYYSNQNWEDHKMAHHYTPTHYMMHPSRSYRSTTSTKA